MNCPPKGAENQRPLVSKSAKKPRVERLEIRVNSAKTSALMWALLAGMVMHPSDGVAKPELLVGSIADAEVVAALKSGFNLPVIGAEKSSLSKLPKGEWAADIAKEKLRLTAILKTYGYLNASISQKGFPSGRGGGRPQLTGADNLESADLIQLEAVSGDIYRIGSIELRGVIGSDLSPVVQDELSGLLARYTGAIARADTLNKLEGEIVWLILRAAHPSVRVKIRDILPDVLTSTAAVQITIEAGKFARFGAVTFNGLHRTSPQALVRYIPFTEGENFDPLKLEALKVNLEQLLMFRVVKVEVGDATNASGFMPVQVQLREKNPAPEQLAISGFTGLVITAVTLAILGINQIAIAGGASSRFTRPLNLLHLILLATTGILAFYRVLTFLGAA